LRLVSLHQKQIISSGLQKRRAQASLAIQGVSHENFAFPADGLDEARSDGKLTFLFLFFLLLLLLFFAELALRFDACWFPLGVNVGFLNMRLSSARFPSDGRPS
jgi:hypothetical protein